MPSARPTWKGQMRLSLVAIDVELYSATKPGARPSFRQIHEPTGKRIRYEKVVEGVGPVERDEIKKGYEYEKGEYVLLEDEELDAVRLETRRTLELVQFVDETEIPPLYFDAPYFVAPTDELAEEAFRVVRDALRKAKKVGLGQLALRGKEYLVAVRPCGKGMLLETLHYENEIRKSDSFFSDIAAKSSDEELLEVATALIDKKTKAFDIGAFKDHYQAALRDLIERKKKAKGRKISVDDGDRPSGERDNVIDLMSALKQSLEGGGRTRKAAPSAKRAPAASKPKRAAKSSAKPAAKSASRKKAS